MNSKKCFTEIDALFKNNNIKVCDYFNYLRKESSELLDMPADIYNQYAKEFEIIKKEREFYKKNKKYILTKQERGAALEKLVKCFMLGNSPIFEEITNVRTATNEIDIVISWSSMAKQFNLNNSISAAKDKGFIGECKNYTDSVSVTYVGKFYSLLKTCGYKVGILFSINGISGSGWAYGSGLTKKLLLKDGTYILDFNYTDFEKIYNKETNFYNIVEDKIKAMNLDVDYSKLITKHDMAEKLKNKLLQ